MMNKIKQLSKHLINLIAAGEVIERPMNVVKELVENSLDAKSTQISINLIDCGIKQIEVIDNGSGINKIDLPIALMKHTTSKIATDDDLFNILTLGFRGEALASIASVSDFYIASNDGDTNYFIHKKADVLIEEGPANINKGTKIIVKNLFYNTPARFKNLANQYVELSQTEEMINKLALAHPNVNFKLTNNDKILLQTNGNNQLEVAHAIYGADTALKLIEFNGANNLYQINGYCSNNEIFKSNRNAITIIINGRVIKNYSLIKAILDAYQTILPVGKFPTVILNIKCNANILDVNVHPSKLEIRFTDEFGLRQLITSTIKNALINSELLKFRKQDFEEDVEDLKESIDLNYQTNDKSLEESLKEQKEIDPFSSFNLSQIRIIEPKEETKKVDINIQTIDNFTKRHFFSELHYIGQYNITYLLMEHDTTLYIIDQHAAMERVMYEYLQKAILDVTTYQTELIVPIELTFTEAQVEILLSKKEELDRLKISCERLTNNSIVIRKIPTWIPQNNEVSYLSDIFNAFLNNLSLDKSDILDDLIKTMSCKKSIKANMAITIPEIQALMKKLDQCTMPYSCPHGRPTIVKFTNSEIEKMFKRINQ